VPISKCSVSCSQGSRAARTASPRSMSLLVANAPTAPSTPPQAQPQRPSSRPVGDTFSGPSTGRVASGLAPAGRSSAWGGRAAPRPQERRVKARLRVPTSAHLGGPVPLRRWEAVGLAASPVEGRLRRHLVYRPAAPSPTTTKGAQKAGCASSSEPLSIRASMDRRMASERPTFGSRDISRTAPVISFTVASE
jgi:hypothetical protein